MKHAMLIHHEFSRMFDYLSDEEVGMLIRASLEYDIKGSEPSFDDRTLMLCFERIKDCLDRNNQKYEETCRKRTEAAKKRWENIEELKSTISSS